MQTGGAISDQSMLVFYLWAERALLFKSILGQKVQEVTGSRTVSRRSLRGPRGHKWVTISVCHINILSYGTPQLPF